jgi:hypothetical protein
MTGLLTHPLVKAVWGSLLLAFVGQLLFAQPGPWLNRLYIGLIVTLAYLVALASASTYLWEVLHTPHTPGGQP